MRHFLRRFLLDTLQLLRVKVFIEYPIVVWKLKMNNTSVIPLYTQPNFFPWSSTFGVGCKDSSLSIHSFLDWIFSQKTHFFVTCNDIFGQQVIYLSWKRLVAMNVWFSFFFLPRVWGSQTPSLLIFPIFFKFWLIVDWNVLMSRVNSQVLLCGLHLHWGLMSVLSGFRLSMIYHQNEILQTCFRLDKSVTTPWL